MFTVFGIKEDTIFLYFVKKYSDKILTKKGGY